MPPTTQYADSGDYSIAYQIIGDGPVDVLMVQGLMSHLDLQWCDPLFSRFLRRLASFSRLIVMDQRGIGLSDSSATIPSIDERVADLAAVADAVGTDQMFVIGHCHGGPPAIVYTASHPERVTGLILMSTFAKGSPAPDHPELISDEQYAAWLDAIDHWGEGRSLQFFNPSRDEGRVYRQLYATFERAALTRGMARAAVASTREIDVTAALGLVRVPTLVLHCSDDFMPVESGKSLAAAIPDARLVELEGADHVPFMGAGSDEVGSHVRDFIATHHCVSTVPLERFGAFLMTDIVGSTEVASRLGDAEWAELLTRHDAAVRDDIDRERGECVKFTGDGYLAAFGSCEDALRCAAAVQRTAAGFDLTVRCGVHAGGYEHAGQDVIGLTVIVTARLMAAAQGATILVSEVVSSAVAGAGFEFGSTQSFTLKGVAGVVMAAELILQSDPSTSIGRWRPDAAVHGPSPTRIDRFVLAGARRFPQAAHIVAKAMWRTSN